MTTATRTELDGRATLYGGDALAILAELETASVDAVVTDPPYSSGGFTRGDRAADPRSKYVQSGYSQHLDQFTGDNRDQRGYLYWSALWLSEALRVARPGAPIVMLSDWRQLPTSTDAMQLGGWVWRGIVPWAKPWARPQPGRFIASCEYAVWGTAGPFPGEGSPLPGFHTPEPDPEPLPGHVQTPAPAAKIREHITQKPLDLMRKLIRICPPGGVVLDPFMGSGSTGVAALLEGRQFVGVEQAPTHLATAERRIREALGEHPDRGEQTALDLDLAGGAS